MGKKFSIFLIFKQMENHKPMEKSRQILYLQILIYTSAALLFFVSGMLYDQFFCKFVAFLMVMFTLIITVLGHTDETLKILFNKFKIKKNVIVKKPIVVEKKIIVKKEKNDKPFFKNLKDNFIIWIHK
jgi:hypothetical protein